MSKLFEDELRAKANKTPRLKALTPSNMYRQAAGYKQAILKVSSYAKTAKGVGAHLSYTSRENELPLEDPNGNLLTEPDEIQSVIDYWASDNDNRKNSRIAVNMVLSAPEGSSVVSVREAVRQFAKDQFGDNHDYLFAIHTDTLHPHAHLSVKMRGFDGTKLRIGKDELQTMRSMFAEKLREQGIKAVATPRFARAVGTKSERQSIQQMKKRAAEGKYDKKIWTAESQIKQALETMDQPVCGEWEKRMLDRYISTMAEYGATIEALKKGSKSQQEMALSIEEFAKTLKPPKTKRQEIIERVTSKTRAMDSKQSKINEKGDNHDRDR